MFDMIIEQPRLVTLDEFEQLLTQPEQQERLLELIHGEIVEKRPTEEHGEIQLIIGGALRTFVITRKLGRVSVETRHRMPGDTQNSRLPDISYIAGNRPRVTEGSVPQMPDLAVEIKSPDDSLKGLREKAQYYMANGTRMVWLVDPAKRLAIMLTPDDEQILLENEALDGGDVLPGFSLPLREVFADPLAE
ncbi:MAG: Uma2 family endonuclease [Anaerolineae bacterium]|nr:Uma2 family endonuclease [Anaerolineae bacterium]